MDTTIETLDGLLLRDVRWSVKTAGPSPFDNERTELFLLGCKKAITGNPCKGCFNSSTWDSSKAQFSHDPILMAQHIANTAPNKYITIGGGDPLDQIDNLIILCKELKRYGFHIMVYTWRRVEYLLKIPTLFSQKFIDGGHIKYEYVGKEKVLELFKYIDILVDGEYKAEERMWDGEAEDGFISSIGSGNQVVWDIKTEIGFAMRDLKTISLTGSNALRFELKNPNCKPYHYIKGGRINA